MLGKEKASLKAHYYYYYFYYYLTNGAVNPEQPIIPFIIRISTKYPRVCNDANIYTYIHIYVQLT